MQQVQTPENTGLAQWQLDWNYSKFLTLETAADIHGILERNFDGRKISIVSCWYGSNEPPNVQTSEVFTLQKFVDEPSRAGISFNLSKSGDGFFVTQSATTPSVWQRDMRRFAFSIGKLTMTYIDHHDNRHCIIYAIEDFEGP